MTFADAIKNLRDGKAAKTPNMKGFVKRTDIAKTQSDTWDSKFKITFVESSTNNNADSDNHAEYSFTHEITAGAETITGPDYDLKMDALLYKLLFRNDWSILDVADASSSNSSTPTRW